MKRGVISVEVRALKDDVVVPLHSTSGERSKYVIGGAGNGTRQVEVFNAHKPRAAVDPRFKKARNGCYQRAEMQRPRRTRREAAAVGRSHFGKAAIGISA